MHLSNKIITRISMRVMILLPDIKLYEPDDLEYWIVYQKVVKSDDIWKFIKEADILLKLFHTRIQNTELLMSLEDVVCILESGKKATFSYDKLKKLWRSMND